MFTCSKSFFQLQWDSYVKGCTALGRNGSHNTSKLQQKGTLKQLETLKKHRSGCSESHKIHVCQSMCRPLIGHI